MPGDRHCASCGTRVSRMPRANVPASEVAFVPLNLPGTRVQAPRARRSLILIISLVGVILAGGLATAAYAVSQFTSGEESSEARVSLDDHAVQVAAADQFGHRDDRVADGSEANDLEPVDKPDLVFVVVDPARPLGPAAFVDEPERLLDGAHAIHIPLAETPQRLAEGARTVSIASFDIYHGAREVVAVSLDGVSFITQAMAAPQHYPGDGTGGAPSRGWHPGDGTRGAPMPV